MKWFNKLFRRTEATAKSVKIPPTSIVSVDVLLPECQLRQLRTGTRDPELMLTLFHAVNPAYPPPAFGSLVGTPSPRDQRLAMVTSRMADRVKADPEMGCVMQSRDITLRDMTNGTGAAFAKFTVTLCTFFRKKRRDDKSFILTDDLPLVP